jgi:o-succinylbenzoate synthase
MKTSIHKPFSFEVHGKDYKVKIKKHLLEFNFTARTSRGAMEFKPTYLVEVTDLFTANVGIGECSPLSGLSPEYDADYETNLQAFCTQLANLQQPANVFDLPEIIKYPSICFGFETALKDLESASEKVIFKNQFSSGKATLPINGLVWMGDYQFMLDQMQEKIEKGFTCIKLKIGGIDFSKECAILEKLRTEFSSDKIIIRLDANGAFSPDISLQKLVHLAAFDVHSIEQPVKQGQYKVMAGLCKNAPIPIALDEELIGICDKEGKEKMLDYIKPQYIILKPSLIGGFRATAEWIALAEERGVNWWITSALESNIGLNAIAQFTANYQNDIPQGLGTGQLYHNNITSPLFIENGRLGLSSSIEWGPIDF